MDKLQSQYNMLTRKVLIAAESGEYDKFKGLFTGRQSEEIELALTDVSQERFNEVLGNVRFTPLIAGAWHGHVDVVKCLLTDYKDIVNVNQIGFVTHEGKQREVTALCAAIRQRKLEIAQYLIDVGAMIDKCCPLAIACNLADIHSTKFLIKNKTDVNAREDTGLTCLMVATERHCLFLVRMLLNNGADARLADADGNTALHRLALKPRMFVLKNGPLPQIIDALVNAGAQMTKNQAEQTPLDAACISGNVEVARFMMNLPEVRPEESLTAECRINEFLERALEERRNQTAANGDNSSIARRISYEEKFKNPNVQRKLRKSRFTVGEKSADISGYGDVDSTKDLDLSNEEQNGEPNGERNGERNGEQCSAQGGEETSGKNGEQSGEQSGEESGLQNGEQS